MMPGGDESHILFKNGLPIQRLRGQPALTKCPLCGRSPGQGTGGADGKEDESPVLKKRR